MGLLAGHLLHGNPFLGMLVGVGLGLATGVAVDAAIRMSAKRRESGLVSREVE